MSLLLDLIVLWWICFEVSKHSYLSNFSKLFNRPKIYINSLIFHFCLDALRQMLLFELAENTIRARKRQIKDILLANLADSGAICSFHSFINTICVCTIINMNFFKTRHLNISQNASYLIFVTSSLKYYSQWALCICHRCLTDLGKTWIEDIKNLRNI